LNLSITGPIYLNMLWTSIFTCHSSALWEWSILLSRRWCTTTLTLRHQKLLRWNSTKSMHRTKRKC
jgi:hypothetical protein